MEGIVFIFIISVLLYIVFRTFINLYTAINTTLERITIENKIKLKEYKKIRNDLF